MTPVQFAEDLARELGGVLGNIRLQAPSGKESGINIFTFGLPIEKTQEDRGKKFPYALITLEEGGVQGADDPQKVKANILIGVYDNGMENQGKAWVLNIINDISERFLKNPVLEPCYYADDEITWVMDREEEYPYHYGAVGMVFNIPAVRREDEYA